LVEAVSGKQSNGVVSLLDALSKHGATDSAWNKSVLKKLAEHAQGGNDEVATVLVRLGDGAGAALAPGLKSRKPAVKQRCIELVGRLGYKPAWDRLVQLLDSADRDVCRAAARALLAVDSRRAIGEVAARSARLPPDSLLFAIEAAVSNGLERPGRELLTSLLKSPSVVVVGAAASALRSSPEPPEDEAIRELASLQNHGSASGRQSNAAAKSERLLQTWAGATQRDTGHTAG